MAIPPDLIKQITGSGLILVLSGGVMALLKGVPGKIWESFVRQVTVLVTVKSEEPAFDWTKEWVYRQKFTRSIRRVDLDSSLTGSLLTLMPAPGGHVFWKGHRPFHLSFDRETDSKSYERKETYTFRTLGRDRRVLEKFLTEIIESHDQSRRMVSSLHVWRDTYWERSVAYSPRKLESVILPSGESEKLVEDVAQFLSRKEFYKDLGIPYHRGYMFYGPPGTGKTSIISGIGGHFGLSVYFLNLKELTDSKLAIAADRIPANSIILFEDIDVVGLPSRNLEESVKEEKKEGLPTFGVTLSGLLNVLDGFAAPDGVLYMMTTNDIGKLDEALLRPGRIDYRLYLGNATLHQKRELYFRFHPQHSSEQADAFIDKTSEKDTMAEIQGRLLRTTQAKVEVTNATV